MTFDINVVKREFVAGGTAGAIGVFIGFPMDLVKTQIQTFPNRFPSAWSCLKHQFQEGGVVGLFRGCIPPILAQGNSFSIHTLIKAKVLTHNLYRADKQFNVCRRKYDHAFS